MQRLLDTDSLVAAHQLGAAFATFCAGALRTISGSYTLAFFSAGALCVIAALVVLPIGKGQRREVQPAMA